MKRNIGWLTLLIVAIAFATLFKGFILRLVCSDYVIGMLFVFALYIDELLEWIWHLPLRRIDIAISSDPLKPSASELCKNIREAFRRIYSDGGRYLVYIAPLPSTGMRIAFNLVKQRIEAKCGSSRFAIEESNYQLPPFKVDDSQVVYRLSGAEGEYVDGVYLCISAKRGKRIEISKLKVSNFVSIIADILLLAFSLLLDVFPVIIGAILIRRSRISKIFGFWRVVLIAIAIPVIMWRVYHFYW